MSGIAARFLVDDAAPLSPTIEFAVVAGTWWEMGQQLGQQYGARLGAAALERVAAEVSAHGGYEAARHRVRAYVPLIDSTFQHPVDGTLMDFIRGVSDGSGLIEDDVLMLAVWGRAEEAAGVASPSRSEHADGCSMVMTWGTANRAGGGVIAGMNSDNEFVYFAHLPAVLYRPRSGNSFLAHRTFFGYVMNDKGLAIGTANGAWDAVPDHDRIGVMPMMYLAAYCDSTSEVIEVVGDPRVTSPDRWWPIDIDWNMMVGDRSGHVIHFELTGSARGVRENNRDGRGTPKLLGRTAAGTVALADETDDYLISNNSFLSEEMLAGSRSNVANGLDWLWPDTIVRYWTVERGVQDAIERGGVDAEQIRAVQSAHRYYIPPGWDFDAYPQRGYYGFWVPSDIYERFERGDLDRRDYYGASYDPEVWGPPLSLRESREVTSWRTGWHDVHEHGWSETLDTAYWSPEPLVADLMTTNRAIFDSNTLDAYLLRGSAHRGLSAIPYSTGVYSRLTLVPSMSEADFRDRAVPALVRGMRLDAKRQLWLAARDLQRRGVDLDSADGRVVDDRLAVARQAVFDGQRDEALALLSESGPASLALYGRAITHFAAAQVSAQLVQDHGERIEKDGGALHP